MFVRMRKLKLHISVSLDGFASSPDGGFEWIVYNEEVERYAHGLTKSADTVVFGRVTYKGMQSYWPTVPGNPASSPAEVSHAKWLERATKIVVSETLTAAEADWETTILLGGNFAEEIQKYRRQPGGEMVSFGSPTLVRSLVLLGLYDELHLNINPVILGGGKPLFGPQERQSIKLVDTRQMAGGVVGLCFAPLGK